jgi:hypothetical protein
MLSIHSERYQDLELPPCIYTCYSGDVSISEWNHWIIHIRAPSHPHSWKSHQAMQSFADDSVESSRDLSLLLIVSSHSPSFTFNFLRLFGC